MIGCSLLSPNEVKVLGLEAGWNTYAYVGNSPVEAMVMAMFL